MTEKHILRPYVSSQVMSSAEVAIVAGIHEKTARDWARRHHLGRMIAGKMAFDRVAVLLYLEGRSKILADYLSGDRESREIKEVYSAFGIDLLPQSIAAE